jgi:hypothetical protein
MKRYLVVLIGCLLAAPTAAQTISLGMPIACNYGVDCFIQNYVDNDSTGAYSDFTCGPLSYNKHKGTDFRLINEAALANNVPVIAAADGKVRGVRDGMADQSVKIVGMAAIKNRECGNGVAIHHPAGYETQYCHMQKGSIKVRPGQPVKAGDVLGYVGLSGATVFPHVHLQVRRLGKVYDPFTGEPMGTKCGGSRKPFWNTATQKKLVYIPTALLSHGFSSKMPKSEEIRRMREVPVEFARSEPALVYWADIMGLKPGDTLKLTVFGPNNTPWAERTVPITKSLAQMFSMVGKNATPEGLVPGTYQAKVTVERKGAVILERETRAEVRF